MIAIDTNILVYSVREDSPWHRAAITCVKRLAESGKAWAVPWPCIHEFIAVVTHPRIYKPPTPLEDAVLQVDYWMESPALRLIGEGPGYWDHLKSMLLGGRIAGPLVHEARVAAICRSSGVRELWTVDRDFSRFGTLAVRNPLVAATNERPLR